MQELKFDKEIHSKFEDIAIIDYGIVEGNNIIVFIKAGQNGSLYGYQNKYVKMAKRLKKNMDVLSYVLQIHLMVIIH